MVEVEGTRDPAAGILHCRAQTKSGPQQTVVGIVVSVIIMTIILCERKKPDETGVGWKLSSGVVLFFLGT